jgi:enoyl-[acyl-carrier protein] reductase I
MKLLENKKGLIMGVANDRSIAWGIAQKLSEHGAELAFTYVGDALKKRVIPLAESLGSKFTLDCNVESKEQIITTRENFLKSMLISCFSFTEVAKEAALIMNEGGSMLTLTYESTKVIPNYNVMGVCKSALETSTKYLARDLGSRGIRVNAISAGPIKTLAASAIGDAKFLYKWNADHSLLKRNVDIHDVGNSALYLVSHLSGGVTGEIHYVDAGYNKVGMPDPKNITS